MSRARAGRKLLILVFSLALGIQAIPAGAMGHCRYPDSASCKQDAESASSCMKPETSSFVGSEQDRAHDSECKEEQAKGSCCCITSSSSTSNTVAMSAPAGFSVEWTALYDTSTPPLPANFRIPPARFELSDNLPHGPPPSPEHDRAPPLGA